MKVYEQGEGSEAVREGEEGQQLWRREEERGEERPVSGDETHKPPKNDTTTYNKTHSGVEGGREAWEVVRRTALEKVAGAVRQPTAANTHTRGARVVRPL